MIIAVVWSAVIWEDFRWKISAVAMLLLLSRAGLLSFTKILKTLTFEIEIKLK